MYKLWTTRIVILATDYIESRKILSPEQEGLRAERSRDRAITHLGLCVEDGHSHKKDIVLCYLNFKGAFPSTDHKQLVRVLEFLGLPSDFTRFGFQPIQWSDHTIHHYTRSHLTGGDPTGNPPGETLISPPIRPDGRTAHQMAHRLGQGLKGYNINPPHQLK